MASNMEEMREKMSERLSCAICFLQYNNKDRIPKSFPCLHTFCVSCIGEMINKGIYISCPMCREQVTAPRGGAASFKTNICVLNLLDLLDEDRSDLPGTNAIPTVNCIKHNGKEVAYICLTCTVGLCPTCIVSATSQHAHHEVKEVQDALDHIAMKIKDRLRRAKTELTDRQSFANEKLKQAEEWWRIKQTPLNQAIHNLEEKKLKLQQIENLWESCLQSKSFELFKISQSLKEIENSDDCITNVHDEHLPFKLDVTLWSSEGNNAASLNIDHLQAERDWLIRSSLQRTSKAKMIAQLSVIDVALDVIVLQHSEGIVDDVMIQAWAFLWNGTNENHLAVNRFVSRGGLELAVDCFKQNSNKKDLLQPILGVMGNVSECAFTRQHFLTEDILGLLSATFKCAVDNNHLPYRAVRIVALLMADKQLRWSGNLPAIKDLNDMMITEIEKWPYSLTLNSSYSSFRPLLHLLDAWHVPAAQYWLLWTLKYFSHIHPKRYCPIIKRENGLAGLQNIVQDERCLLKMKQVATDILKKCEQY